MIIDHIFIFSNDKGLVVDDLIVFGLREGSSRVHPNQGTTNRKFYFDNFFLEILWVSDFDEINSDLIRNTGLTTRAYGYHDKYSPFGLCLEKCKETDELFKNSLTYQPTYFPDGKMIEFIDIDTVPSLPWIFRLPFTSKKDNNTEPKDHGNGICFLSKADFECKDIFSDTHLEKINSFDKIRFIKSKRNWLTLSFDNKVQKKTKTFEKLCLTIEY